MKKRSKSGGGKRRQVEGHLVGVEDVVLRRFFPFFSVSVLGVRLRVVVDVVVEVVVSRRKELVLGVFN